MSFISPGINIHRGNNLFVGDITPNPTGEGWSKTLNGNTLISGDLNRVGSPSEQLTSTWSFGAMERVGGQWYFEIVMTNGKSIFAPCMGLAGSNSNKSSDYSNSNSSEPTQPSNWISVNGFFNGVLTVLPLVNGDVINVAVNYATSSVWLGVNGVYIGGGDPASGLNPSKVGGAAFSFGRGRPMMFNQGGNISNGSIQTLNMHDSEFLFPVPVGFLAWGP